MNIDTNKRKSHPKTIDPKPPPSKTHTTKQIRETELNDKHRVQNQCVLGLIDRNGPLPTSRLRSKVVCCAMGAHKGTYNPDSHLHSTTGIPSSDLTDLHPRPTGGPFSEGSYLSARMSIPIVLLFIPTGQKTMTGLDVQQLLLIFP